MRRWTLLMSMVALAVACTGGSATTSTSRAATSSTAAPASTVTHGTIAPFVEVGVGVADGPHGPHLVDPDGRSLYLFALDEDRTSSCEGACAEAWPPFLGDGVAGDGVDQSLLGNAERSNGSIQVTYGGHPLYLYSGDLAPGDVGGHGFNEVWFLVGPDGEAVTG